MIKIGINENIFLKGIAYDATKNWCTITFEEAGGIKYASTFDRMNADTAVESLPTRDLRIFCPLEPFKEDAKKNPRTLQQRVGDINNSLMSIKAIYLHLLYGYMTEKEAALTNMYANLGIDANNYDTLIVQPEVFTKAFKQMSEQFIEKATPVLGKEDKLFRLLLVRQDAANAFPTFRKKYIVENPFWESMTIPKEQSKVAFTDYELKEGLNLDIPASRSDADKKGTTQGKQGDAPLTPEGVFG